MPRPESDGTSAPGELTEEQRLARLQAVARRWSAAKFPHSKQYMRLWNPAAAAEVMVFCLLLLALTLEFSLFQPIELPPMRPLWALSAIVLTFLTNGWLVEHQCNVRFPDDERLSLSLRALRFAVGGLPFLGLWILEAWPALLARLPPSSLRSRLPVAKIPRPGWTSGFWVWSRSWAARPRMRRFLNWFPRMWLGMASPALYFVLAIWLGLGRMEADLRKNWILAALVFVHGAGLVATLGLQWNRVNRLAIFGWRRAGHLFFPAIWLLPFPFLLLNFLPGLAAGGDGIRSRTLIWKAQAGQAQHQVLQIGRWLTSKGGGGSRSTASTSLLSWSKKQNLRSGRPEPTSVEKQWTAICRLKTLLLGFDSFLLVWWGGQVVKNLQGARVAIEVTALLGAALLLFASLGGLLWRAWEAIRTALRDEPLRLSFSQASYYLFICPLTAIFGLGFGLVVLGSGAHGAGLFLALAAIAAALICVLTGMLSHAVPRSSNHSSADTLLWGVFFLALAAFGAYLALEESEPLLTATLLFVVFATPLAHLLLFLSLSHWLTPRGVGTGSSVPRRGEKFWRSWLQAFLLLPLGGLLVPWWILLRRREDPEHSEVL